MTGRTSSATERNSTEPRDGMASAICQCCNRQSKPVPTDAAGDPDLWKMPRGWSQAPFPVRTQHADGSRGSRYTCPGCNSKLRRGATLPLRGGKSIRNVA